MQDKEMAEANAFDAGLFEGDIALTQQEDIVEMYGLETVSSQ